jgi:NAD+ synthase (glutamine-hydrolysing)
MEGLNNVRVAAANIKISLADCEHNTKEMSEVIERASKLDIEVLVFPELALTGYTCGDLFHQSLLIDESEKAVLKLLDYTMEKDMLVVFGAPVMKDGKLFNCAILIHRGIVLGIIPKSYLPNYNEFYEKRWFNSGLLEKDGYVDYCGFRVPFGVDLLVSNGSHNDLVIGVEICEDLWSPIPPSSYLAVNGATLILNLSASNDLVGKGDYRRSLVKNQSARTIAAYVYASAGYGESTTDLVFGGHHLIVENGQVLKESQRYQMEGTLIYSDIDLDVIRHDRMKANTFFTEQKRAYRWIEYRTHPKNKSIERHYPTMPFVPDNKMDRETRCNEIFNIQTVGLAKRVEHIGAKTFLIGVSGGLDSTLALLVCARTCDMLGLPRSSIKAITMPGFGTTNRTYKNAVSLAKALGTRLSEISIEKASKQHFEDIGHDGIQKDVTYENTQARERTQILMDLANLHQGIVVGTGDLSELAMGWATYNGDHMSMYGVNSGVPKTLVRFLISWIAEMELFDGTKAILQSILETPVSPELIPPDENGEITQNTEEIIGPYILHDFFIFHVLRYGTEPGKMMTIAEHAFKDQYSYDEIHKWMKHFYWRFITQQYKRSCLPDGPKVGSVCLSPRGDWKAPSDSSPRMWMKRIEEIK